MARSRLMGRELQRLPVPAHRVRPGVQLQRPEPQHPLAPAALPPEPPQHGLDPGEQLLGVEGLGDVVVSTELEPHHLVHGLALGREQHHRDVALLPHLLQYLEPAHARQHDVQDHEVEVLAVESPQGLRPVLRRDHPVALRLQHDGGHLQKRRVVVDQQYNLVQASRNLQIYPKEVWISYPMPQHSCSPAANSSREQKT